MADRNEILKDLEGYRRGDFGESEMLNRLEIKAAVAWDPEAAQLPRRPRAIEGAGGWFIMPEDGPFAGEAQKRDTLRLAVNAYNERQEIDEIEADVDDAISAGLAALCREEIDAQVQRGVQDERARCLAIMDWLLGSLPQGWDFARRFAKAARGKVASGVKQRGAGPAWTGADDLPNPEPGRAAFDFAGAGKACAEEELAEGRAASPEPAPEWPERLSFMKVLVLGYRGEMVDRPVLAFVADDHSDWRHLDVDEVREAARRWEEEPRLRERIERAETYMRHHWPALASGRDGVVQKLWRILTGKES